jgi:VanZ family protein
VRKCAHFLEFTGLGLLFGIALFAQIEEPKTPLAIILTSVYAVTDEIHQIFVEGRACRFIDWVIDTAGGALGAIAFLIILLLIRKTAGKNKKAIDS